jgi:hypothetical protein
MKVTAREEDLVPWCRSFYPCLALNLGRRIEHSSRTLNFCQLAGVRLFLETGDVVTDALSLKVRHREAFGEDSPPDILWEYLLRDKPGRGEGDLYRAAASRLAAEMDAVERSLQRFEDQSPSWAGKESRR